VVIWTGPTEAGLWNAATGQRVSAVPANDVAAAVAHVNANAASGPFTLAIDDDVSTSGSTLSGANANLTIVGIGEQREIRFINLANNQRLFTLNPPRAAVAP